MARVTLESVSKVYDKKVHAVQRVNLDIPDKEFIVLVGPSGCGKSTLLRMIAGLEEITSGTVRIGERVVNDIPPKDRNIAMVFQNYALYPHMTVFDNMAFGLKLRKFSKNEIKKRVADAAALLGIEALLDRKPKALSGGQRQRVAVGRAIVRQPLVFLFDEPLSNLDAKLRVQMRIEISKLHRRLESTMIYVTHDQVEAMTMGDKIVVLKDGFIQQVDSPINLYEKPANLFVAGFIGSPAMNFFSGQLQKNGNLKFKSKSFEITLDTTAENRLKKHDKNTVVLGIRPEHFSLQHQTESNQPQFKAEIEVIEPMGNEMFAYLKCGDEHFTIRTNTMEGLEVGKSARLQIDSRKIHFFDPDNERVITN
ncbi:MAG: sn-glycerol-3-phosphate ABC transporter ATP-binding protein UgpC [Caldithrix sp.]|nr:sn-glycerol-3-phosphate ABC transporter ATP-binding protein UgpC [Caldithrix sp.]